MNLLSLLPDVRGWSRATVLLRVTMLLTGAVALVVAPGGRLVTPGLIALVGAIALIGAVGWPDGAGPAVVLGAAALAWTVRYGVGRAPVLPTVVLALALALHHQAAALAAAVPPTATVDRAVLARFGRHGAVVLGLSAAVAVVALGVGRPGGSVPLEVAGLVAVVLVTAVPVLLSRRL